MCTLTHRGKEKPCGPMEMDHPAADRQGNCDLTVTYLKLLRKVLSFPFDLCVFTFVQFWSVLFC